MKMLVFRLRKIEVICQEKEQDGTIEIQRILEVINSLICSKLAQPNVQILYETEDGFAPPDELGSLDEENINTDDLQNGELR